MLNCIEICEFVRPLQTSLGKFFPFAAQLRAEPLPRLSEVVCKFPKHGLRDDEPDLSPCKLCSEAS